MRPIIINGQWFCTDKICGIRRYAFEIIRNLDQILEEEKINIDIRIVYPSYSNIYIDELRNIQIIKLDVGKRHFNCRF